MTEDKVTSTHPKYDELSEPRQAFADVKAGTRAMRKAGEKYLPKYPAESPEAFKRRRSASTIDGIVQGGVETLCGAVFEGEIDTTKVKIDKAILEDFDNLGTHFSVFVRDAFEASFDGCSVIVIDMPEETDDSRKLKAERGAEADKILNIRPYAILYKACDVTNWRFEKNIITGIKELVLLVVKIEREIPIGSFGSKKVTEYRVWKKEGNAVIWELWVPKDDSEAEYILDKSGPCVNVTQIPASFIGDVCDPPKLLGETDLEIKAYQKESSYDEIEYLSPPTLVTKGYDSDEPIAVGAEAHIKLGADPAADAFYLQMDAAGHDTLKQTFKDVKAEIKGRVNMIVSATMPKEKTATETISEDKDKQARLVVWAQQLKDAVERALGFAAEFMGKGADGGGEIVLRTKWDIAKEQAEIDAQRKSEEHQANIAVMGAKAK